MAYPILGKIGKLSGGGQLQQYRKIHYCPSIALGMQGTVRYMIFIASFNLHFTVSIIIFIYLFLDKGIK